MVNVSHEEDGCISLGPWGGQEGEPWSYKTDGRINQIIVRHGWAVDSIMFQGQSCGCLTPEWSKKFGGDRGRTDKIIIDSAVEQLKTISLTWGEFEGESAVRSICFHTNLTEYGPFGSTEGSNSVSIPIEGGFIVGFHGRAGRGNRLLNAIGVYVAPKIRSFCPLIQDAENSSIHIETMMSSMPRDPGPWGGSGGKHWDDGVFSSIKKVLVNNAALGSSALVAVRFQYEKADGKCFRSSWHGGGDGRDCYPSITIELDNPTEVIVGIEGFYGPLKEGGNGYEALTSITFYTNQRKYGPYGNEIGKHFSSMYYGGKVVGFFGRSGTHLNAIGVHMEYF